MRTHIKPAAKQLVNRWLVIQDLGRQRQTHWPSSLGYLFQTIERPSKMGDAWGMAPAVVSGLCIEVNRCPLVSPWRQPNASIFVFPHPSFTDVLFFCHGHWHLGDQNWAELLKLPVSMSSETVACSMPVFWVVWCQKQGKDNSVSKDTERRCFHLAGIKFRMSVIFACLELIT